MMLFKMNTLTPYLKKIMAMVLYNTFKIIKHLVEVGLKDSQATLILLAHATFIESTKNSCAGTEKIYDCQQ